MLQLVWKRGGEQGQSRPSNVSYRREGSHFVGYTHSLPSKTVHHRSVQSPSRCNDSVPANCGREGGDGLILVGW
jgi:hypothetical protein